MFLLFTASGSAGALLDEAESGTLDRVLSTRVTMTKLLAGKLVFNTVLAFIQLVAMFLWGWAVFKLDFFNHLPGFAVMGLCTAFAVAAFGMLLASACRTRAQLGALSTLLILIMSSVGGSMFPRFLMPESMQKAGLLTINAWAIDGFTKVFLAGFAGEGTVAAGDGAVGDRRGAVCDRAQSGAALGAADSDHVVGRRQHVSTVSDAGAMQKAGLLTINAWAIDGFTKVFWRDLPVKELWPQVTVLLAVGVGLFAIARRVARKWEYA